MKLRSVVLCLMIAALALPAMAEKSPVKAGKWKVTIATEIPGMPVKMPPITVENCVTKEMAENPEATIPQDKRQKSSCKVNDYKLDGNTISWTLDCPKEQMKGEGSITYSDDSFEGTMEATMGEMQMKSTYKGSYVGACEK